MKIVTLLFLFFSLFASTQDFAVEHIRYYNLSSIGDPKLVKYQHYVFKLLHPDLDTVNFSYKLKLKENLKAKQTNDLILYHHVTTSSLNFMVEVYSKQQKLEKREFIEFEVGYSEGFDPSWETKSISEVVKEMDEHKHLNASVKNDFIMHYWIGKSFPDTVLKTLEDQPFRMQFDKGKKYIVDFTSLGCGPCLQEEFSLDSMLFMDGFQHVTLVMVYDFMSKKQKERILQKSSRVVKVVDKTLYSDYFFLKAVPCKFFIDENGIIQLVEMGALTHDKQGNELRRGQFNPEIPAYYLELVNQF